MITLNSNQVIAAIGQQVDSLAPVMFGRMPATPDDVIGVAIYHDDRDIADRSPHIRFQARSRTAGSDPRSTNDLADAVVGVLHGVSHARWGGVMVLQCRMHLRGPLVLDDQGRYERMDSYTLILNPS